MKNSSQATQASASSIAPITVATGANGLRQQARRRQRGHAVGESAQKYAERPLRDAVPAKN